MRLAPKISLADVFYLLFCLFPKLETACSQNVMFHLHINIKDQNVGPLNEKQS